jgi:hypothetical protein
VHTDANRDRHAVPVPHRGACRTRAADPDAKEERVTVRVGLVTGKEWVVEATAHDVITRIHRGAPGPLLFESNGGSVHIYREHIAYIEDEMPAETHQSPSEQRGVVSG